MDTGSTLTLIGIVVGVLSVIGTCVFYGGRLSGAVDGLVKKIDSFDGKIDAVAKAQIDQRVAHASIEARVSHLEGHLCGEREDSE